MTPINASFFKMFLPIIVVGAGLVAYKLQSIGEIELLKHPMTGKAWNDTAIPVLIARYYPAGLVGLGITALLAGFMAGQAGNVSAFNTVWTYDIYRAVFKKDASDAHLVLVGRITTIVGIFLSVVTAYVAMQFDTIMDYIQAIFSWVNAPLFATMLLGMFWRRCTSAGAFWGLLLGMGTSFGIYLGFRFGWFSEGVIYMITLAKNPSAMAQNVWQAAWAWVVCLAATFVISTFTTPKPDAELKGLVRGLMTRSDADGDAPLIKKPGFWAAISLAVLVALNILFW